MNKSRSQKASLNITTNALLEIVTMISTMILPRFVLKYFGSSYNGIVSSASQFLSLISLLTLGVTASTRVALYQSLAKNDNHATSAIVRATEKYMRKVGLVLLVYIIGLAIVYPLVVHTDFGFWDVSFLIFIVGASSFAEYYFGITYRTFLLADQCVYISNVFSIIALILNTGLSIFLITSGFSIQIVKLFSAMVFFLRPLLQNIYVTKKYSLDKHCEPDRSALDKRGDATALALANIVHDNTDIVVLTVFTDVKTISVYTIYNMVMNGLKKIQQVMTTGTEPIFGNMWAKKEYEAIKRNLAVFEFFITFFLSVVFSCAMVLLLPFVSIYTSGITDVEYVRPAYGIVICAAFIFLGLRAPYLSLVQGVGHYKETKIGAFIEAGINITLSVVLVNFIGMIGVAVGTLAANIFRTVQYAIYIDNHIVARGKSVFIRKILWCLMNITIISVPIYHLSFEYASKGWLYWILTAVVVVLIALAFTTVSSLIFYRKDLKNSMTVGKNMLLRRRKKSA